MEVVLKESEVGRLEKIKVRSLAVGFPPSFPDLTSPFEPLSGPQESRMRCGACSLSLGAFSALATGVQESWEPRVTVG